MPEVLYLNLSKEFHLYALRLSQTKGQYRATLLEKGIWIDALLAVQFDVRFSEPPTFNGVKDCYFNFVGQPITAWFLCWASPYR